MQPWLTAEEVWAAISATHADQFGIPAEDPSARLMDITLRRVRDSLEAGAGERGTAEWGSAADLLLQGADTREGGCA